MRMDERHKRILIKLRKDIVNDVDVSNIMDILISEGIISPCNRESINHEKTKKKKIQLLLDIIPSRGPQAFGVLRDALAKHYSWISDKMNSLDNDDTVDNASEPIPSDIKRNTSSPDLPIPIPTVNRKKKITELINRLEQLKPGEYLALHGLKGFGKSSLMATTLKDSDFNKSLFNNEFYLIKFGVDQTNPEGRLMQLTRLFNLVENSEVPSELNNSYLLHNLEKHFQKENHRDALLVLDDVCDEAVIDTFNFGCKTLVLTDDINVLKGKKYSSIQMNDGFTATESLQLFADTLDVDVNKLLPQAKSIHQECRGMPLMIAMLAAQFEEFKEDMKVNAGRWNYYLEALRGGDTENGIVRAIQEKLERIFDMSINSLSPELQKCYKDLAIFHEDVNITSETLEILWGKRKYKVDELMLDLCKKSLAAKEWNQGLGKYIYCVHELLLRHLRNMLSEDDLTKLHRSFVEKYFDLCKGDFSKLPKDNYIHGYIGHHLEQAKMYSEFPNLYLNFSFIEAKLSHLGPSDLQIDLFKYQKHITNNKDSESKFANLEEFLMRQAKILAEHRRRECLDLKQVILGHPRAGFIMQTAQELAGERTDSLYLRGQERSTEIQPSMELLTQTRTACFTDDLSQILIANNVGEIYLCNCNTHEYVPITGHRMEHAIVKMIVSEESNNVLSLSEDGILKLFSINEISHNHCKESEISSEKLASPKLKQDNWRGFFGNKNPSETSLLTFNSPGEKIVDMKFSKGDDMVAYSSDKGRIAVSDLHGNIIFNTQLSNCDPCCVAFTTQNKLLHVVPQSTGCVHTYHKKNGKYEYLTAYNCQLNGENIISMQCVPHIVNQLILTTNKQVKLVEWCWNEGYNLTQYNKRKLANADEDVVFICATLTFDGQYLVTADSSGRVAVWNVYKGFDAIYTYHSIVTSLDTYWLVEENCHVICGVGQHNLLHRWKFEVQEQPTLPGLYLCDAVMDAERQKDIIAVTTSTNAVKIFQNDNVLTQTNSVNGKITHLVIDQSGDTIVYATEHGQIHLFELKNNKAICIRKLAGPPRFMNLLNTGTENMIVCSENEHLMVWENEYASYELENTGSIISCFLMNQSKHIMTVAQGAKIVLWDRKTSRRLNILVSENNFFGINHCCLNSSGNYLALVNKHGRMVIHGIETDDTVQPYRMKMREIMAQSFEPKLTYCTFSPDDRLLAIGCENGDILIIDVANGKLIHTLMLHRNTVKQLAFAPPLIDVPILMSLSCNEVAWWNIALLTEKGQQRRSRTGISCSMQNLNFKESPSSNKGLSKSASMEACGSRSGISHFPKLSLELESAGSNSNGIDKTSVSSQWKSKQAKDPRRPALLGMIGLSLNDARKICISPDFSTFVTVDNDGLIYKLTLFQSDQ